MQSEVNSSNCGSVSNLAL